jgi:hypothetical protein
VSLGYNNCNIQYICRPGRIYTFVAIWQGTRVHVQSSQVFISEAVGHRAKIMKIWNPWSMITITRLNFHFGCHGNGQVCLSKVSRTIPDTAGRRANIMKICAPWAVITYIQRSPYYVAPLQSNFPLFRDLVA